MRNVLTLFAFIAAVTIISCKKDNEAQKPQFADIEFEMYDLKATGDTTISYVTYPNTIILKSDYTWTIDLGGAKSNGTYSLTPTESYRAQVKFTIQQWTSLSSNVALSNKLKSVLETVANCGFPGPNITELHFIDDTYTTYLRTFKK